ncbi:MAG TPA: helix-turn-helix domain-containing protein [Caulobacteraceae bacterium]|nr:helix-turn-helix domain-containing protein [Caulobacteraceae bacterium]
MTGAELRKRRERLLLTQAAVAERLNVSAATVRNWEGEVTAIPMAVEMVWEVLERRLRQESPHFGTLTLFYTGGPLWIPPEGPRRSLGVPGREAFVTNAGALARVCALRGREGFESPMIVQESGEILWTSAELERVADGADSGAPTLPRMLLKLADYVRAYSGRYVREGPRLPSPTEVAARRGEIEKQADLLEAIASNDRPTAIDPTHFQAIDQRLHQLGMFPPGEVVNGIHHAYAAREHPWPIAA